MALEQTITAIDGIEDNTARYRQAVLTAVLVMELYSPEKLRRLGETALKR